MRGGVASKRVKPKPPQAHTISFAAPTRGWIRNENLAASKPAGATVLDNMFPLSTGVRLRRGTDLYARIGDGERVGAIIPYVVGDTTKLFAANTNAIYDITDGNGEDNDDYVKVLLHFDGADASTTVTDAAFGATETHTWTAAGNAQIDTAASKFGGASGLFDGTGDYWTTPDSVDFTLGGEDFTIDFWFNCNAAGGAVRRIAGQSDNSLTASASSFNIRRIAANTITAGVYVGSTEFSVAGTTQFTDALNTGWHHLAFTRDGSVLRLFIDGVQEGGNVAISGSVNDSANALSVGQTGEVTSAQWLGWVDEFRLSVGIARWTTTFTPPTAPYEIIADVESLTNGNWEHVQVTTSGGTYIRMVNGEDTPLVYDGSSWGTSPALTGVTPETLSHVWLFKNRLFFIEKNTLNAWYLATDAIGGALTKFPLGGVVKLGGSLMFGASWSVDSGDGFAEKCVFVTSEGEVAVYNGSNPGDASDWVLQGVYRIGRPLGPGAVVKGGGDLAIATDIGLIPLSKAITMDKAAIGAHAVSYAIEEEWKTEVAQRVGTYPWHVEMWPTGQMALVAMPSYSSLPLRCFVANLRTGAWARFTGWDTHCLGLYRDRMFYGTSTGTIVEAEVGGLDQGAAYTCTYVGLYTDGGFPVRAKTPTLMRPVYLSPNRVGDKVAVAFDYTVSLPTAPDAEALTGGANTWDNGLWDVALWQAEETPATFKEWRAVSGIGEAIAPIWMVTVGQESAPSCALVRMDLQFTVAKPGHLA